MFLDDMDYLSSMEADLMRVFPLVIIKNSVLLQVLHLIRMGDDGFNSCEGEREGGREGGREGEGKREKERERGVVSCNMNPTEINM